MWAVPAITVTTTLNRMKEKELLNGNWWKKEFGDAELLLMGSTTLHEDSKEWFQISTIKPH